MSSAALVTGIVRVNATMSGPESLLNTLKEVQETRPGVYKRFCMLNSAEHGIKMLISIKISRNPAFSGSDQVNFLYIFNWSY